jgi:addiction module RelE/StbE family toxin
MRLRWTETAAADLEAIKNYLTSKDPLLALPTVEKLYNGIKELKIMPFRGRRGRAPGTRELVFSPLPYIAVYRVQDESIEILHIYHGAQNWSP